MERISIYIYIYPIVVFGSIGLVSLGSLAEAAAYPDLLKFHLSIVRDAGYLLFFGIMFFSGSPFSIGRPWQKAGRSPRI